MPLIIQKNKVLFIVICLILVSLSTYIFSFGTARLSLNSNDLKAFTLQEDEIETVQSEDFYRKIINDYEHDFFILKTDTLIIYSTDNWRDKLGYEESEVIKKNFFSFVHAKDLPFFTNAMIRVIDEGLIEDAIGPFRLKSKSGQDMLYMASATPLYNKEGEIVLIIFVVHDVSVSTENHIENDTTVFEIEEELITML